VQCAENGPAAAVTALWRASLLPLRAGVTGITYWCVRWWRRMAAACLLWRMPAKDQTNLARLAGAGAPDAGHGGYRALILLRAALPLLALHCCALRCAHALCDAALAHALHHRCAAGVAVCTSTPAPLRAAYSACALRACPYERTRRGKKDAIIYGPSDVRLWTRRFAWLTYLRVTAMRISWYC